MLDGMDDFWRMRSWLDISRAAARSGGAQVLPFIRAWAEVRRRALGRARLSRLQPDARRCATPRSRRAGRSTYVLSPTAPITAFAAELASPTNDPLNPFEHIAFTVAYNMSEQPAATINCGYSEAGLPIGLQIVGHRFDDLGVLQVASALEAMRARRGAPWPEPPGA